VTQTLQRIDGIRRAQSAELTGIHSNTLQVSHRQFQHRQTMRGIDCRLVFQRGLRGGYQVNALQIQGVAHSYRATQVANVDRIKSAT
jgi:hypothetical protein